MGSDSNICGGTDVDPSKEFQCTRDKSLNITGKELVSVTQKYTNQMSKLTDSGISTQAKTGCKFVVNPRCIKSPTLPLCLHVTTRSRKRGTELQSALRPLAEAFLL